MCALQILCQSLQMLKPKFFSCLHHTEKPKYINWERHLCTKSPVLRESKLSSYLPLQEIQKTRNASESLGPVTESRQQCDFSHRLENFHFVTPTLKMSAFHHTSHFFGSANWHGRRHPSSGTQASLHASDSLRVDGDMEAREISITFPWKKSLDLHMVWQKL